MGQIIHIIQTHQNPTFMDALSVHLRLSVVSLLIGILISIPLAVLASQSPLASLLTVNISNIGRAVPSLAILAIALPILGFGFVPSVVALTALAIPPIVINTAVALTEVDRNIIEAARGMGMSRLQILIKVQTPIALPIIFAGIRTSAVQVVASATLATFIGGGGLGDFIVEGFQTSNTPVEVTGALTVAILAIFTELLFGGLERVSTPRGLQAR